MSVEATPVTGDEAKVLAALRAGDESAFVALTEQYRGRLHLYCYRMLGSLEEAEDLVQETFLRAWRGRADFEGRSLFRTWLYRIATNACLNMLKRHPRRILVADVPPGDPSARVSPEERADLGAPPTDLPWLEPYPDSLLEQAAPSESEPDAIVVSRETIELAYLAAIQHLPARQRAVLILRDALGLSAKHAADVLELSIASVNSALRRARSTMRTRLPARRLDWAPVTSPTAEEQAVLQRYMDAHDRADVAAFTALLREDVRQSMPPYPSWYEGRAAVAAVFARYIDPDSPDYPGHIRLVPTAANRQLAAAAYLRPPRSAEYRLLGLNVLDIDGGLVREIVSFGVDLLGRFGLPPILESGPT